MMFSKKGLKTIGKHIHVFLLALFLILHIHLSAQEILAGQRNKGVTKKRPYSSNSPWNLKIGPQPVYDPYSNFYVANIHGWFGADAHWFEFPLYEVSKRTPLKKVKISCVYSKVVDNGTRLIIKKRTSVEVPIPKGAKPAKGTDANIIFWNPKTGDEWGFWQAKIQHDGSWLARNGYHYNTKWSAVPPKGFISRGAGLPYFAGLIRPWEIKQGKIEHAIGFSVNYPSPLYVYPATKSDGISKTIPSLPEGARLQLDPTLTKDDFQSWRLNKEGRIIARALQEYGMILVDGSGHPKISVEYEGTAHWGDLLNKNAVSNIPYSAFKLLSLDTPRQPTLPENLCFEIKKKHILLRWNPSPTATRYMVKRRQHGEKHFKLLDKWVTKTYYVDKNVKSGTFYKYKIIAVNHNGLSQPSQVKIFYNGG